MAEPSFVSFKGPHQGCWVIGLVLFLPEKLDYSQIFITILAPDENHASQRKNNAAKNN